MSESGDVIKPAEKVAQPMLRFEDGTPVNILPLVREKDDKGFAPQIERVLPEKTLISVPIGLGEEEYFLVTKLLAGQEIPNSVYVRRIRKDSFRQLQDEGYGVVSPTNIPEGLSSKG